MRVGQLRIEPLDLGRLAAGVRQRRADVENGSSPDVLLDYDEEVGDVNWKSPGVVRRSRSAQYGFAVGRLRCSVRPASLDDSLELACDPRERFVAVGGKRYSPVVSRQLVEMPERSVAPVAVTEHDWNDDCFTGAVSLHRAANFDILAIVGAQEGATDEQQHDASELEPLVDPSRPVTARVDFDGRASR